MQLGTRWILGGAVPTSIPGAMAVAIGEVESALADVDTSSWRWTLTWLEGKPVAELDDGTIVRQSHDGSIVVTSAD